MQQNKPTTQLNNKATKWKKYLQHDRGRVILLNYSSLGKLQASQKMSKRPEEALDKRRHTNGQISQSRCL